MRDQLLLVALLLSLPATAAAEPLGFTTVEVAPGVLAFIQDERGVGNSVAIITDTDVIVVDSTVSPFGSRAIIEAIHARTSKPIRYLVNTHWHDDHIWGNQEFVAAYPGVEIGLKGSCFSPKMPAPCPGTGNPSPSLTIEGRCTCSGK